MIDYARRYFAEHQEIIDFLMVSDYVPCELFFSESLSGKKERIRSEDVAAFLAQASDGKSNLNPVVIFRPSGEIR